MNGGGVESVVMNYYRHIDHARFQFDFLVDADSRFIPRSEIESFGGRLIKIPPYQHQLAYQRELVSLFRRERWPIVHSHVNSLSVFPLRAAKRAGIPVRIAHSHSSNGGGRGEGVKDALKTVLKSQSTRYPTDLVACSDVAGRWLFGENASFTIIRNAIETKRFTPTPERQAAARVALGISERTFVIGHIGRIVPTKNHLFLLDIFKYLLDIEPNSLLLIAGTGPLLSDVKAKAAAFGDKVMFLGQRKDAAELYQAFDVFCLPSFYEGLPVVGIECQASGTPILASTEVTSEAAVTSLMEFEPLSSPPMVWAQRLCSMRGKSLLPNDALGLSEFDIEVNIGKIEKFYSSCLEKNI